MWWVEIAEGLTTVRDPRSDGKDPDGALADQSFPFSVQLVRDRFEVERQLESTDAVERVTLYRPEPISLELALGLAYAF